MASMDNHNDDAETALKEQPKKKEVASPPAPDSETPVLSNIIPNGADGDVVVVVVDDDDKDEKTLQQDKEEQPTTSSSSAGATTTITPATSTTAPLVAPVDPTLRLAIIILYGFLLFVGNSTWIIDTIYVEENWECIACRADKDPTLAQQFLYYTVWSMWGTTAILILWAWKTRPTKKNNSNSGISKKKSEQDEQEEPQSSTSISPDDDKALHILFQVAYPHVMMVFIAYIYYTISYPAAEYVDEEVCHRMLRSFLSKELGIGRMTAVNFYLVLRVISDFAVHWFSFPLLFYFWISGQIQYTTTSSSTSVWWCSTIPWSSTLFVIVLSAVSAVLQNQRGVQVYCGDPWFNIISMAVGNFACSIVTSLASQGYLGFQNRACVLKVCRCSSSSSVDQEEEEEVDFVIASKNGVDDDETPTNQ